MFLKTVSLVKRTLSSGPLWPCPLNTWLIISDYTFDYWYITSEKMGQIFWPSRCVFFGINYHQWTWGDALWQFLAPLGRVRGRGVGEVCGTKFSTFRGATFGSHNQILDCMNWKHFILQVFGQKTATQETKNGLFWAEVGVNISFLKNTLFKLTENAP